MIPDVGCSPLVLVVIGVKVVFVDVTSSVRVKVKSAHC